MYRLLWLLSFMGFAVPLSGADETLAHARRAQALIGNETWSTVIEIENDTPRGPYPKRLHALVFEAAGLLWFYTSVDGTQSFSLHHDNVAQEKADFAPLLRAIDPGFVRWRAVEAEGGSADRPAAAASLPNGCFVESLASWRSQVAAGLEASEPQLLSYYARTPLGRRGHTVLTFATEKGVTVIDSSARRTRTFSSAMRGQALKLARALLGAPVADARWVPLEPPTRTDGKGYLATGGGSAAGASEKSRV